MTLTMTVKEVKENLGIIVEPGKYQLAEILCCAAADHRTYLVKHGKASRIYRRYSVEEACVRAGL